MQKGPKLFRYQTDSLPCCGCGEYFTDVDLVVQYGEKGRRWHAQCFKCKGCGVLLNDSSPKAESEGFAFCESCFNSKFSGTRCAQCRNPISGPYVKMMGKPYHEECLTCDLCNGPITGEYQLKGSRVICGACGGPKRGFIVNPKTGERKFAGKFTPGQ